MTIMQNSLILISTNETGIEMEGGALMQNFWKMDGFSLFTVSYVYVDHNSYLADSLFAQRKIAMKFKEEMARDGSSYCIIFCKVRKRDAPRFEEALGKLYDKMWLLGHRDYVQACNEIAKIIDKEEKRKIK